MCSQIYDHERQHAECEEPPTWYLPPRQTVHIRQVTPGSMVTLSPSFRALFPTTALAASIEPSPLAKAAAASSALAALAATFEPSRATMPEDSWPRHISLVTLTRPRLPVL